MLNDTGKTKDVFIISAHPWFFKNIVADGTMKIFVDIFLKSTVVVVGIATGSNIPVNIFSNMLPSACYYAKQSIHIILKLIFLNKVDLNLQNKCIFGA
jgi:hypothetical protein